MWMPQFMPEHTSNIFARSTQKIGWKGNARVLRQLDLAKKRSSRRARCGVVLGADASCHVDSLLKTNTKSGGCGCAEPCRISGVAEIASGTENTTSGGEKQRR